MRVDLVTIDIPTSGTPVQLTSDGGIADTDRILWARFRGGPANTGTAFVGLSDVTTSHGWSIEKDDDDGLTLNFREFGGSVEASNFWFDVATDGDSVECALILEV